MADFSTSLLHAPPAAVISTASFTCLLADQIILNNSAGAGAVWPAANRAIYVPVTIEQVSTVFQIAFEVVTASGNYDVGVYDEGGTRLVSKGSTAVPAAGLALADVTDTTLNPGTYWLAMAVDNVVASIFRHSIATLGAFTASGLQDQDTAFVLPATATFSTPGSIYYPVMSLAFRSTM